jgi:Tfp pilus assembly protein PilN
MHEVEFLPPWYSALRRRKCAIIVQATASAAILLVLTAAVFGRQWEIHRRQQVVAQYDQQIHQADLQLSKLEGVLAVQQRLRQQERVIGQLGIDMQATRLLSALQDAMPRKMSLTGLSLETQEQSRLPVGQGATPSPLDRWLIVRLQGVAPTDVEVAMLLDSLSRLKFLDSVGMTYIRDRTEATHAMRDFELRFRLNLNTPVEGGT